MASIVLHATQFVFQGTLGAAAAQVGLHLYMKSAATPQQNLNAWAFALIAVCVVGAALGVSTSALLVGVALHTLMLLKARDSFLLSQGHSKFEDSSQLLTAINKETATNALGINYCNVCKVQLDDLSQGHIKVNNFPYHLPLLTEETPTGVLGINYFEVRTTKAKWYYLDQFFCVSTYVSCGETKRCLVDFQVNANETLSTRNNPGLQLSFTFDKTTEETKIVASPNELTHLAIDTLATAHETYLIDSTEKKELANVQLHQGTLYFTQENNRQSFTRSTWTEVEEPPVAQNSNINTVKLFSVPNETSGTVYFLVNKTIFNIPFYKFQDKLHLLDMWGRWICADSPDTPDVRTSNLFNKSQQEELTRKLGLSAGCLLDQLPQAGDGPQEGNPEGTITCAAWNGLRICFPGQSDILLSPSSKLNATSLIYEYTNIEDNSIHVKLIEKDGTLIVDPTDYARLCAFEKEETVEKFNLFD